MLKPLAPTTDQERVRLESEHWIMFRTGDPKEEHWETMSGLASVTISSFSGHIPQVKGGYGQIQQFMAIVAPKGESAAPLSPGYNADDPADCRRAASEMVKRAAALCASACGALADGDDPSTGNIRLQLLDYRVVFNRLAAEIAPNPAAPQEREKGEQR